MKLGPQGTSPTRVAGTRALEPSLLPPYQQETAIGNSSRELWPGTLTWVWPSYPVSTPKPNTHPAFFVPYKKDGNELLKGDVDVTKNSDETVPTTETEDRKWINILCHSRKSLHNVLKTDWWMMERQGRWLLLSSEMLDERQGKWNEKPKTQDPLLQENKVTPPNAKT